ncbi:hypothetical protein LSTR_LSTR000556 [Laodelphax striatellus]|uniref:TFIIS N-terminal domain-containing protein n=1 Tax=Laodelphax striatellus TaxID=195883 RepID=A0A482XB67_LAOST|nr:hypothetical protein LSTR_LSTR000556 [Laodelphax striatellus]
MTSKSITENILHYQKDIDRCPENTARMMRCIQRLFALPVTVQHLQETGIGKSVNALRKYGGEVAEAAKALVYKWKFMVIQEEKNGQSDEASDGEHDSQSIEKINKEKSSRKEDSRKESNNKSSHNSDRRRNSDSVDVDKRKKENDRRSRESVKEEKHSRHTSSKSDGSRENSSRRKRRKDSSSEDDDRTVSSKEEGIDSGSGRDKKKKKSSDVNGISKKSESSPIPSSSKDKNKSSSKSKESSKEARASSSPSPRILSNSSSPFMSNNEDLLSSNIKLKPLDVDLAATLPEISPNYRPMPSDSPSYPDVSPVKSNKGLTQEEALSSILSTKGQRMKVFSGTRGAGYTKIPSLFTLCVHVLRENIVALEYTGGVPYDLLKPVLERATSEQLYQLEHHNPYLIGDTDALWEFHCKKDFRGQSREEMESWRDLYLRCFDEREKKFKELTEKVTQKKIIESIPIKKTKLAYVDSVVKPPRNVARKQAKFGTSSSSSSSQKHELVARAMIGGHSSSGEIAKAVVPPPPQAASRSMNSNPALLKKKKAPLMAKTLQFMKGGRKKW